MIVPAWIVGLPVWIPIVLAWLGGMLLGGALHRAAVASREWEAFHLGIDTLAARLYQDRRVGAQIVTEAADEARRVHILWGGP